MTSGKQAFENTLNTRVVAFCIAEGFVRIRSLNYRVAVGLSKVRALCLKHVGHSTLAVDPRAVLLDLDEMLIRCILLSHELVLASLGVGLV